MKNTLTILIVNSGLLMWSSSIFLNVGITAGTTSWKFYASLLGALVFLTFVGLLSVKILRGIKDAS